MSQLTRRAFLSISATAAAEAGLGDAIAKSQALYGDPAAPVTDQSEAPCLGVPASLAKPALARGYPGTWTGRFIWDSGEPVPYHYFLMARGAMDFGAAPNSAELHITASDRYLLYLNGTYLGRGPARGDARWTSYDSYDIASRVRSGRNIIAVLAYHYGASNGYTRESRAGLFVQVEAVMPGARPYLSGSGAAWRVRPAQGWNRKANQINSFVGMNEVYDANLDPAGWMAPGFDDSGWEHASEIMGQMAPWDSLEPRQTPRMREREIFPVRLVQTGEVQEAPPRTFSDVEVPERLGAEAHVPSTYTHVENPEAVLQHDQRRAVFTAVPYGYLNYYKLLGDLEIGGRGSYVIVDFGRPVFGFPKVRLGGPAQAVVEMTYGPQLADGRVPSMLRNVKYGDRYLMREGEQSWQVFEYRQFRYLQLVVRDTALPVSVDSVSVVSYEYPAEISGSFECSHPLLNSLWKAGVDTVYLSMEDAIVGDAWRERMVYSGDPLEGIYPLFAAFGDLSLVDRSFRLIARGALPDGLVRAFYPAFDNAMGEPPGLRPRQITGAENPSTVPQFSLLYVMFVAEQYRLFARREIVDELYSTLVAITGWCDRHTDADGLLYSLPNVNWVDHVPTEMRGANLETNALYCKALEDLAMLATATGREIDAARWRRQAATVRQAIRRLHWNAQRGMYADSVIEGKQVSTVTELSNAFVLLFDIATAEQIPRIVKTMLDPQAKIVRATPLFYYYVVEGLIRAGAAEAALAQMAARYEKMLRASDFPTIWETWDNPTVSQVLASGAGPTLTLSQHVLGIRPAEPGFRKCRIAPQMAGLEWARGAFPSPRGPIKVEWKQAGGAFTLDVNLPAEMLAEITLERPPGTNLVLTHNGAKYAIPARGASVESIEVSERKLTIHIEGGNHRLELRRR